MYAWAQHSRVRPLPLARCLVSTKFAAGNEQAVRARKSCSSEVRFSQNSSALSPSIEEVGAVALIPSAKRGGGRCPVSVCRPRPAPVAVAIPGLLNPHVLQAAQGARSGRTKI